MMLSMWFLLLMWCGSQHFGRDPPGRSLLFSNQKSRITHHYATFTVICPGIVIVITPPQVHMHVEVLVRAGAPLIIVIGAPGTQGVLVTGMHGIGVSTPSAAVVAVATVGLVGVIH